jgi:hypothetical protein
MVLLHKLADIAPTTEFPRPGQTASLSLLSFIDDFPASCCFLKDSKPEERIMK